MRNTFLPLKLLLVAALVLASFTHTVYAHDKLAPSGYDVRAFAAQFSLPDGTLPVLCEQSGSGNPHHSSTVPCEFCSIAGIALPVGSQAVSIDCLRTTTVQILKPDTTNALGRPLYRTLSQSQAPPSV